VEVLQRLGGAAVELRRAVAVAGEGTADIYSDGGMIHVTWKHPNRDLPVVYYDASGNPVAGNNLRFSSTDPGEKRITKVASPWTSSPAAARRS